MGIDERVDGVCARLAGVIMFVGGVVVVDVLCVPNIICFCLLRVCLFGGWWWWVVSCIFCEDGGDEYDDDGGCGSEVSAREK